jgi:hypothetical protein
MAPVAWPAAGFCVVAAPMVGAAGATATVALRGLSPPVNVLSTGVTVYCHVP